jgi:hypothetical protein
VTSPNTSDDRRKDGNTHHQQEMMNAQPIGRNKRNAPNYEASGAGVLAPT